MKKAKKNRFDLLIDHLMTKASKARLSRGRFTNRMEKRLVKRLKRIFDAQLIWVLKEAQKLNSFNQAEDVKMYTKKEISFDVALMLEDMPYQEDLADDLELLASQTMLRAGKAQISKMKLGSAGIVFSLNHPEAVSYLEALKELHLSNYRGSINRTTKDKIKKLLVDGANEGLSYTEVAKQITAQGKAGVFSQARGELIATREIGFAYSKGERVVVDDYVQETGAVIEKNWLTANDGSVRDTHTQNQNDGWISINDYFSGTGEDAAPSNDFGCRCVTSYREV